MEAKLLKGLNPKNRPPNPAGGTPGGDPSHAARGQGPQEPLGIAEVPLRLPVRVQQPRVPQRLLRGGANRICPALLSAADGEKETATGHSYPQKESRESWTNFDFLVPPKFLQQLFFSETKRKKITQFSTTS